MLTSSCTGLASSRLLSLGCLSGGGSESCESRSLTLNLLGNLLSSFHGDLGIASGLLLTTSKTDSLSVSLLEGPVSASVGKDSLGDVSFSAANGWAATSSLGSSSDNLLVAELLDCGLEFIISVEIAWVASWMEVLLKLWLEAVYNQSALESSV